MEVSEILKERFCKDNNLNIKIYTEPYFTERLTLYDNQFNTLSKFELFKKEIEEFKTEQDYLQYYNKVKNEVIDYIKACPAYERLQNEDMNKFAIDNHKISHSQIYNESNNHESFISIDLKKGCYTAMRHYDKELVANTNTYEDFMRKFTDKEHIINSKYIRQVIFGACNPKRQTTIEKYLMSKMMEQFQQLDLDYDAYTDDEIIIRYNEKGKKEFEKIKEIVYKTTKEYDFDVHFDVFEIEKYKKTDAYIKKIYGSDEIEIKGANHLIMPFLLRDLNNEKPSPNDFAFFEKGNLVYFMEIKELDLVNDMFKPYLQPTITTQIIDEER